MAREQGGPGLRRNPTTHEEWVAGLRFAAATAQAPEGMRRWPPEEVPTLEGYASGDVAGVAARSGRCPVCGAEAPPLRLPVPRQCRSGVVDISPAGYPGVVVALQVSSGHLGSCSCGEPLPVASVEVRVAQDVPDPSLLVELAWGAWQGALRDVRGVGPGWPGDDPPPETAP